MRAIRESNNFRLLTRSSFRMVNGMKQGTIDDRIRIYHFFSLWFDDKQYINFHQRDNFCYGPEYNTRTNTIRAV